VTSSSKEFEREAQRLRRDRREKLQSPSEKVDTTVEMASALLRITGGLLWPKATVFSWRKGMVGF